MTPEKIELLKQAKDLLITFLQELMAVFITAELPPVTKQLAQLGLVLVVVIFVTLIVGLVVTLISRLITPPLESLSKEPTYLLIIVLSVLLLFFTSQVTFKAGCLALMAFIFLHYGYDWYKNQPRKNFDERRSD